MTKAERADIAGLMLLPAFRRFMLRQINFAGLHAAGLGAHDRSLEYREGQRSAVLQMIAECGEPLPVARTNPEGALAATLIQILSEADQTARKEIARGGSRFDDDGSGDGGPDGDDDR